MSHHVAMVTVPPTYSMRWCVMVATIIKSAVSYVAKSVRWLVKMWPTAVCWLSTNRLTGHTVCDSKLNSETSLHWLFIYFWVHIHIWIIISLSLPPVSLRTLHLVRSWTTRKRWSITLRLGTSPVPSTSCSSGGSRETLTRKPVRWVQP